MYPNHEIYSKPDDFELSESFEMDEDKQKLAHKNIDGPYWQQVKPGLCLKGLCHNIHCSAYKSTIAVNIKTPVIYKFDLSKKLYSFCPLCGEFVEPVVVTISCGNIEWRSLAIEQTNENETKVVKTEWIIGDENKDFVISEMANKQIVIETKSRFNSLTKEFKCKRCLSHHLPIHNNNNNMKNNKSNKNIQGDNFKICRHDFYDRFVSSNFSNDLDFEPK